MRRRHLGRLLAVAVPRWCWPAAATTVQGNAVSVFDDPFKVAGMPAVDGPTGLRPDAEKPSRDVDDSDGGKIDEIAAQSVSDIEDVLGGRLRRRPSTASSPRSRR